MKRRSFLILPLVVLMAGCGHKSKNELVDIEQFKCQDSIQTVFDVLGSAELQEDSFLGEIYEYNNLNLWGYDGYAIFRVRADEDTIQSFDCHLTLNKKEFEDVLYQLSDKYGHYEKSEYTTQTAYTWEIPEDDAQRLGYCRISFSDYGDKKAVIDFSDEWSICTDEAYYEHLEEEKQANVLSSKTYTIGEDTFDFSFEQNGNDDYSFKLLCWIADKADAFSAQVSLNAIMNSDEPSIKSFLDAIDFSYYIFIGDGTIIIKTENISYVTSNNGEIVDITDYFSPEWTLSEERHDSDYGTQIVNFMVDFIQNE